MPQPTTLSRRLLRSLGAALLGGILAWLAAALILLAAGNPLYESQPTGYMNPSAAVGESVAFVLKAATTFALGACLGVVANVLWRRVRAGQGK